MSYTLNMTVVNNSSQVLSDYAVSHDWDGNVNALAGTNLPVGGASAGVTITSGAIQHDDYSVKVTYANGESFNASFYCDASSDQTAVQIQINNDSCNCVYFVNGGVATGCYNKS